MIASLQGNAPFKGRAKGRADQVSGRKHSIRVAILLLPVFALISPPAAFAETRVVDEFLAENRFDPSDAASPYFWSTVGEFVGDQVTITQEDGYVILNSDPYEKTVTQGEPLATPLDHVKHLTYRDEKFLAGAGERVVYTLDIQAWVNGVENHPFGSDAVTDPAKDLRLASVAMTTVDFDTFVIADYFITQECIYPFWERLAVGQGDEKLGDYRAYSSIGPCVARQNGDRHELSIIYDRGNKRFEWLVEGTEVFRTVDPIGHAPTNATILIDHGGNDTEVDPDGFYAGFASFSLLDARDPLSPGNSGLVRLSLDPGLATDGSVYERPSSFADAESKHSSRIFGQGTRSIVYRYEIDVVPSQ